MISSTITGPEHLVFSITFEILLHIKLLIFCFLSRVTINKNAFQVLRKIHFMAGAVSTIA